MKRLNFDSLTNLNIPDFWIENALKIPDKNKNKVLFFRNFSRIASTVACLMIVCATSLSVLLFMNNNGNIPVSNHTSTVDTTSGSSTTKGTDNISEVTVTENESFFTYFQYQASFEKSTEKSESNDVPLHNPEPTEKHKVNELLTPQESFTHYVPEPPETIVPTFPTNQWQTTAPATEAPSTQALVTMPSATAPTPSGDDWLDVQSVGICYGDFSKSLFAGNVYCRLYDSNGKLVGDSNLYSSQHIAHFIIESGDRVYVQYHLEKTGLNLTEGTYSYCFYNANGVDLCQGLVNMY